jgi:phosphonate transport system ATP-binding protein
MLWAVIEFLGIGMAGRDGEWLLHRVCARFAPGQIVVVLSNNAEERHAMLDVAAGKRLPDEGRLWLGGLAIARHSLGDLRARIAEIDFGRGVAERRSLFWNTLASGPPGRSPLNGFARLPRPNQRRAALEALDWVDLREEAQRPAGALDADQRARLAVARALARRPDWLIARDLDPSLGTESAEPLLSLLRQLTRAGRASVLASVASPWLGRRFADRLVLLAEGLLVFDGSPASLTEEAINSRLGVRARARRR